MESVFALIEGLQKQESALVETDHRIKLLKIKSNELYQALLFSLAGLSSLQGGAILDSQEILQGAAKIPSPKEAVIDSLQEVQGAWPFIQSNINLLHDASKAAMEQGEVARRLTLPLIPQLQAAQASSHFGGVDRVSLTAFNSDMAQFDARINLMNLISSDLMKDMGNALEIFTGLRIQVEKSKTVLSSRITSALSSIISSAGEAGSLIQQIVETIRNSFGAPLIHPEILGYSASGDLGQAVSHLYRLKEDLKKRNH